MAPTYDVCYRMQGVLHQGRTKPVRLGAHELRVERLQKRLLGKDGEVSVFEAVGQSAKQAWATATDVCTKGVANVASASEKRVKEEFDRRFGGLGDIEVVRNGEGETIFREGGEAAKRDLEAAQVLIKELRRSRMRDHVVERREGVWG